MDIATAFNAVLFAAVATVLATAMVSEALRNRFIASEPIVALGIGFAVGPFGLDLIGLDDLTSHVPLLLEELARVTLAVAILAACLRVGWSWVRRHMRDLLVILLLGLPLMWLLTFTALQIALPMGLATTVLLAAVLTPTDPVLAQAVVTSTSAEENIPGDLRHLISIESAANDGLALLFVMPFVILLGDNAALTIAKLVHLVAWEVPAALAAGGALGWLVGRLMRATAGTWATETGLLGASLALAIVALTGLKLLGMDGLFGVFGAGIGLSATLGEENQARHASFNHTLAELFQLPLLVVIGMALPVDDWFAMGWPLLAAAVLVLLFRRLPMLLAIKPVMRTVTDWPSAVFAGWFGPIGVAALFYAVLAVKEAGLTEAYTVATAVITGSVLAHGVTDTVGSSLFRSATGRP